MTTVSRVGGMETRWWRDATSGAAAGMVSVLALHPLDVIKTRLQVQDGVDRRAAAYRGTVHAFRTVARQEGARGFYAGVVPAVVGSTVSWGVYFTCYNNAKARYRRARDLEHLPSHLHLASAAEAGLVVSLATNPIWVVKTRLQLQKKTSQSDAANAQTRGGTAVRPYRGFVDALGQIARNEGIAGLYKGLGPSVFLVSHGALQFAAYERLRAWRTK
jgi:solute carrier family 25 folate transporter 32